MLHDLARLRRFLGAGLGQEFCRHSPVRILQAQNCLFFFFRSVGSICPRVPSALTVKVPPQAVLRQFVSISDDTCFKIHSPWLLAFRQSGYALLTARQRQEIPATPYPR